eukprot:symbB.v1.2.027493.t1/scaffold2823.1/size69429/5
MELSYPLLAVPLAALLRRCRTSFAETVCEFCPMPKSLLSLRPASSQHCKKPLTSRWIVSRTNMNTSCR